MNINSKVASVDGSSVNNVKRHSDTKTDNMPQRNESNFYTDEVTISDAARSLLNDSTSNAEISRPDIQQSRFSEYFATNLTSELKNPLETFETIRMAFTLHNDYIDAGKGITAEERAVIREAALETAQYIADNYLGKEDATHFMTEINRANREAELEEKGYVRIYNAFQNSNISYVDTGSDLYSYGRPTDQLGNWNTSRDFLQDVMSEEEKAKYSKLMEENRINNLSGSLRKDSSELRAFEIEMLYKYEYGKVQDEWLSGKASSDNWFAKQADKFDKDAQSKTDEITAIKENYHAVNVDDFDVLKAWQNNMLDLFSKFNNRGNENTQGYSLLQLLKSNNTKTIN